MAKNDKKPADTTDAPATDTQDTALAAEEAASTEGLVEMTKDGERLHVHPTTVEAHQAAGWKLA